MFISQSTFKLLERIQGPKKEVTKFNGFFISVALVNYSEIGCDPNMKFSHIPS